MTTYLNLRSVPMAPKIASLFLGPAQVPELRVCFAPRHLLAFSMQGDSPQGPTKDMGGPALQPCPHAPLTPYVAAIPVAESVGQQPVPGHMLNSSRVPFLSCPQNSFGCC